MEVSCSQSWLNVAFSAENAPVNRSRLALFTLALNRFVTTKISNLYNIALVKNYCEGKIEKNVFFFPQ